jgi:hypothetical protein
MQLIPITIFMTSGIFQATSTSAPINAVVKLISSLRSSIAEEGKKQQQEFSELACRCESKLQTTASDIESGKKLIDDTSMLISKESARRGSTGAEVANIKKQLKENLASVNDATALRKKELAQYEEDRRENENTIGALEAATKVLGTGSKGFLDRSTHSAAASNTEKLKK